MCQDRRERARTLNVQSITTFWSSATTELTLINLTFATPDAHNSFPSSFTSQIPRKIGSQFFPMYGGLKARVEVHLPASILTQRSCNTPYDTRLVENQFSVSTYYTFLSIISHMIKLHRVPNGYITHLVMPSLCISQKRRTS